MQLDLEAVVELQQILAEEYKKTLSIDETRIIGDKLINLYGMLLNNNKNKKYETKRLSPIT